MSRRLELYKAFSEIPGVAGVYYQPPTNVQMKYPCIRYALSSDKTLLANNGIYALRPRYSVTVIDKSPDSAIAAAVRMMPYCSMDRPPYVADNLNHFVFSIY